MATVFLSSRLYLAMIMVELWRAGVCVHVYAHPCLIMDFNETRVGDR